MKMFDCLDAIITIIKSQITLGVITSLSIDRVYDYEPGDGMPDIPFFPAVFIYESQSDFSKGSSAAEGEQDHEPDYYIDIYAGAKAEKNTTTDEITFSVEKTHQILRSVASDLYDNALRWARFPAELKKIIGDSGTAYVSRYEKLGVTKLQEASISIAASRFTFRVELTEEPTTDDGNPYEGSNDCVVPRNNLEGENLWPK